MATDLKTGQSPKDANAKTKREPKPPVPAVKRISDQLKKATLASKISSEELEQIATLANSLKVFLA